MQRLEEDIDDPTTAASEHGLVYGKTCSDHGCTRRLLDEDPRRVEQREGDEPDERRSGDERGVAHLPEK